MKVQRPRELHLSLSTIEFLVEDELFDTYLANLFRAEKAVAVSGTANCEEDSVRLTTGPPGPREPKAFLEL